MISAICYHINNFFYADDCVNKGEYEITGGRIALPFIVPGQYFQIIGSVFNNGIHRSGDDDLIDEKFSGFIRACAIPQDFLELVKEIEEYVKSDQSKASAYVSESFGGYSYTKGSQGAESWQNVFKSRLSQYRRLRNI